MLRNPKLRAVSTTILMFLISISAISILFFTVMYTYSLYNVAVRELRNTVRYAQQQRLYQLVINKTPSFVEVINIGPHDLVISKVLIQKYTGIIEARDPATLCEASLVRSMGKLLCKHVDGEYVAFITADGIVIYPHEPIVFGVFQEVNATKITMVDFALRSPLDLHRVFNVSLDLISKPYRRENAVVNYTGMNSTYIFVLDREFSNTVISTNISGIRFGVVAVAYDPSWVLEKASGINSTPRYTIMLTAPNLGSNETVTIGDNVIRLNNTGTRIIVSNFTGTIRIFRNNTVIACSSSILSVCGSTPPAIGLWYYGVNLTMRIHIEGSASYIAYYVRTSPSSSPTLSTSYLPYLFVGDIDGNWLNDLIFITEDTTYGSSSVTNDRFGTVDLSDWSLRPILLRLIPAGRGLGSHDGSIDGRVFSGAVLYLSIFFHDNSYPDTDQLRDIDRTDWVLRIVLVDEAGNITIVREFRYQEICLFHKTLIEDFHRDNYFTKISQSIYVSFPDTKKYWIGIMLQDPYGTGPTNDGDLTIGLELVGVLPLHR